MKPTYTYKCLEHGYFSIQLSMLDAVATLPCPMCGEICSRAWRKDLLITDQIWHCQGAHRTDYDEHGDKLERLNRNWEHKTGTKAPRPDRSVPRNSSEIT